MSVSLFLFIHQLYEYFKIYIRWKERKTFINYTTKNTIKSYRIKRTTVLTKTAGYRYAEVNADIVPKHRHSNPFLDKSNSPEHDDAVVAVDELCEFAKLL
jgi:hypothetical protein